MRHKTPHVLRLALERLATPVQPDVNCEPVILDKVDGEWIVAPGAAKDCAILYLHGGGYVAGSVNTHRALMGRLSRAAQARVLGLNYRLAPENPFPAALDDAVGAYRFLLRSGFLPSRIAIAGDSAGGGLAISALVAGRDVGLPVVAAAACLSPWVDLEAQGKLMTHAGLDPIASRDELLALANAYLGGKDPRTPLAAPLHADLHDLPPILVQVGGAETLLDDSTRITERAAQAGVSVTLEVWPGMTHVWQQLAHSLPEGECALQRVGEFIRRHTR